MPQLRCKKCDKYIGNTECRCPEVCKKCGHPNQAHPGGGRCKVKGDPVYFREMLIMRACLCFCKKFIK